MCSIVWSTTSAVVLGAAVEAGADRDPPAAPAEGDAAVGGGAEVVDQGAAVGDALSPGPADLLEQLGHRLGEHDVGGGDREPAAQRPAQALGGAADREHRRAPARTAPPAVRASTPSAGVRSARIGEDSKISTPLASSRSRRPSARRAGCTVAASGKKTPPRKAGEAQRSATSLGVERLRPRRPRRARGRRRAPRSRDLVLGRGGRDLEVAGRAGTRRRPPPPRRTRRSRRPRRSAARATASAPLVAPAPAHVRQREPHHVAEAAVAPARARARSARRPRAGRPAPRAPAP